MKHRKFVYVGDTVPDIDEKQYGEFILTYQKAVIAFLEKRSLLTGTQSQRCMEMLGSQFNAMKGNRK